MGMYGKIRLVRGLVLFGVICISSALAQEVTCTPGVPPSNCQFLASLFSSHKVRSQVVIATPVLFRIEKDSIFQKFAIAFRAGDLHNPTIPNAYSDEIVFERGDETCPTKVLISTGLFYPVKIKEDAKGARTVDQTEGFDAASVLHVVTYVAGFVEGCQMGKAMYLTDALNKSRPVR